MPDDMRPAAGHPVPGRRPTAAAGRTGPAAGPTAADRRPAAPGQPPAAPGMLRWTEELVNTRSIETGRDEIATPALLASWLRDRRLLPAGVPVTSDEHDRAGRIREGLRELIAANNAGPAAGDSAPGGRRRRRDPGSPALANLAELARRLPLVLDLDGSQPRLMPLSRGTADTVLASLLGAVAEAVASGAWDRLKICRNPDCRWAYYDLSRNRSRAWCSMAVCGNRAKARAFRARGR
jgi:predicted RNA-binding Zn ribbon-like protein